MSQPTERPTPEESRIFQSSKPPLITNAADINPPRVQAVQMMARYIYEDGMVAGVSTTPQEVPRDVMDPSVRIPDQLIQQLVNMHGMTLVQAMLAQHPDDIYRMARREAEHRRASAETRAAEAREQKAAELRGEKYNPPDAAPQIELPVSVRDNRSNENENSDSE